MDFIRQQSSYSSGTSSFCGSSNSEEEIGVMLASRCPKRSAGRKKFQETRHPVYRGVRSRKNGKWVCEVREPNKKTRIWLGTHETAEMAARAHDVAALAMRGTSACINFADSVWRLPLPDSNEVKDIQKAASEAAQMFCPHTKSSSSSSSSSSPHRRTTKMVIAPTKMELQEEISNVLYNMEEDETEYGLGELLASMAEGLLLVPPPYVASSDEQFNMENDYEVSLWSFSI